MENRKNNRKQKSLKKASDGRKRTSSPMTPVLVMDDIVTTIDADINVTSVAPPPSSARHLSSHGPSDALK
jgi:hypothetical protein